MNHTVEQRDLTDIFRTFHPRVGEYTFFSSVHGIVYSIDHMIGHKYNLHTFKNIEVISSKVFENRDIKL